MGLITTRQSVKQFIDDFLRTSPASSMIQDWKIEESELIMIITTHFQSLGIYYIEPSMREVLEKDIIFQLQFSKTILEKVEFAADTEKRRRVLQNKNKDRFS